MLSKVLNYLKSGGVANISTIARKLDIEEGTVVMILDQLVKKGYLEEIDDSEKSNDFCPPVKCSSCPKIVGCDDMLKLKYRIVK
ncbi:MAG: MarR family transcriptional regulator [Asgard group archaeon]|nr:MarR family transcriptional regulator [Asgard group archaeon]